MMICFEPCSDRSTALTLELTSMLRLRSARSAVTISVRETTTCSQTKTSHISLQHHTNALTGIVCRVPT